MVQGFCEGGDLASTSDHASSDSCGFQAPTFRHPRLGPAEIGDSYNFHNHQVPQQKVVTGPATPFTALRTTPNRIRTKKFPKGL